MGEEEGEEKREKGVDYDASLLMSAWKIPVDYKVYKGRLGGDLTVNDAYGNLVYRVSGRSFSSSPRSIKTLFDASGTPLISAAFLDSGWQGFKGNSWDSKDLVFTAQKSVYSAFKTEIIISMADGSVEDPKLTYRLIGSPFFRSCTIYQENSIVAQTNLLYKLKKVIYSRQKFRLTVYPEVDHVLVLAMLIIFFGGY
ncbi:protein LURP-one-related 7 [Dioscorea cayenensis subsp. rotundata]|uniref:Protein LURP-one-related 7 n=1 Tax=Dioscorea cayennensis subsp. rotundata TaxID=55577 RepID=A0AB40BNW4_DIOCR|nr:protein LURP-one-related 7 [Dioscorea cayenensis subsp. rotundata]